MHLAKYRHGVRPQPDHARAAGMEPCRHLSGDLGAGRRPEGGQNRLGIGLHVKDVDHPARPMRIARRRRPHQQARCLHRLLARLAAREDRAKFEQRQIHEATRLIAGGRAQQARQQIGAQMRHLGRDRIFDPQRIRAAAEQRRARVVDEAVGHAFIVAQRRDLAARRALADLRGGQYRPRHAGLHPRHRLAHQPGERGHAGYFLDQISLALHIGAPAGRRDLIAFQRKAQGGQGLALIGLGDVHADQALHPRRREAIAAGGIRHRAVHHHFGGRATAEIEDHLRRQIEARQGEGRVHAALEPIACVRVDLQCAPGGGDGDRVPEGAFKDHVGGVLGAARQLAAHDSGQTFRSLIVRDQHHPRLHGVGLAVQRQQRLAALGRMDAQLALDLGRVKDVQRAVQREGEEIGDIDQRRDRPQPDRLQPRLQPFGRGAILHAADRAGGKERAALFLEISVDADRDRRGELAADLRDLQRFQRAEAPGRQIAGKSAHAQPVRPVGGDLDLDHRVVQALVVDEAHANRRILGQLDDAVVVVRQFQLALRTQHAVAVHAAQIAGLQVHAGAWDMRADRGKHADQAGAGIGRAAHHLHLLHRALGALRPGGHTADPQAVGVRVLNGFDHAANAKGAQPGGRVFDPLDLMAQIGQRGQDLVQRGAGFQVILQPGQGELHRRPLRSVYSANICWP